MIGVIFFWVVYIVALVQLYTIVFKTYDKTRLPSEYYGSLHYEITDNDSRHKYPLWAIISFILIYFIPSANIIIYTTFMIVYSDVNHVYFKSFLNKKY